MGAGEAQLADTVDQVLADRAGNLALPGGVWRVREVSVDGVGEERERDAEIDQEWDLGTSWRRQTMH